MNQLASFHQYYQEIFKGYHKNTLSFKENVFQIYNNVPITMKINMISHPIMSADIMAQDIARALKNGKKLPSIFKKYLKSL
jgi:ribosomal protein S3